MIKLQFTLPFLRFKGFNDNWVKSKITKIADIVTGITYDSNDLNDNGKYFVVRANNINSDKFINSNFVRINIDNVKQKFFLKVNDILICSNSGSKNLLGKNCLIENVYNDYLIGGFMMVFRNYDPIVYPLLKTNRWKRYIQLDNSSTINSITKDKLNHIYFYIPFSIEEKKKIFLFFRLIDKHIELWERKLQLCLLKKKYYLNKLFFSNTHLSFLRFKEFCDGVKFEENLLYSISKLKKGEQINNSDLSKNGKYYYQNGGINPSGFLDNYNEHEDTISISEGGESCGFCKWNDKKFWAGGHLFTVKVFDPKIDNKYLYFYLKSKEKQIMRLRVGGALPNIQKSDLEKIKVVNPGILEQMKISKFLSLLDKEIELLEKNISYLKNKKKFYISNMFI